MSFYGYEPGTYVDNFDWVRDTGKDLSHVPEAIATAKAINDGKIHNNDIYTALTQIAEGIDNEEFQKAYGVPKQQFMRMAKPEKNEKPGMYLARAAILTEKGNANMSTLRGNDSFTKEVLARAQGLGAPATETEKTGVSAEGMTPDTIGTLEAIPSQKRPGYDEFIADGGTEEDYTGMFGEVPKPQAEPLTPTGIQQIGAKHGVSKDIMEPYIADAEQGIAERQITGLDDAKNRTEAYGTAIQEGPIGSATEKALATVPTQSDLAGIDIKKQMAEVKKVADRDKAAYRANTILLRKQALGAKTAEQKQMLKTEVMKLKVAAETAKSRILNDSAKNEVALGNLQKTSWAGADPEQITSAAEAIEKAQKHSEEYDMIIQGYQDIIDGIEVPTIQPKPAGSGTKPSPQQGKLPQFSSPSDPAFKNLPSGSWFLDSTGTKRRKK